MVLGAEQNVEFLNENLDLCYNCENEFWVIRNLNEHIDNVHEEENKGKRFDWLSVNYVDIHFQA